MQATGEWADQISLYIPPRRPLYDVINQIGNEQTFALGIVPVNHQIVILGMLQLIRATLLRMNQTKEGTLEPNGVAIFCNPEGMEIVYPRQPITVSLYRCDTQFYKEHLPA